MNFIYHSLRQLLLMSFKGALTKQKTVHSAYFMVKNIHLISFT